jgi:geranylgeranyl diphosphate synthase type II
MTAMSRIERTLEEAIARAEVAAGPPRLAAALRYAVFPGGARVRPMLCLAVARACGDDRPEIANAAAAAIELLHCASLVHDDLPCFDDAATRRGRPSVHAAFGEPLAVLAGDGLIVLAFETLGRAGFAAPERLPRLLTTIAAATGVPHGIVAGQAWECEPSLDLSTYHRAKTGALFTAATLAGAAAANGTADAWSLLGERLGEAYQVADDLHDVASAAEDLGKPVGQDAAHGRANAVDRLGIDGTIRHLRGLVAEAIDSIPDCDGNADLRALIQAQAKRFIPSSLATRVAA